jgi:hypothetical protein
MARGRPRKAIKILETEIEKLGFREDVRTVHGMIVMAHLLNQIDDMERRAFEILLEEKESELIY